MEFFRFLWPSDLDPAPGVVGRLGRVLHWTITAFAALCATGILWANPDYWKVLYGLTALASFLIGRGVRYVLSDE